MKPSKTEHVEELHYFVPCPHCHKDIELDFSNIAWEDNNPRTAHYRCQECGGVFGDEEKAEILKSGQWKRAEKKANRPTTTRWINSLYSPFIRFSDVVEEFLRCMNDPELFKNFMTLWLAEPWE